MKWSFKQRLPRMKQAKARLYDLNDKTGWIIGQKQTGKYYSQFLNIRRSNCVDPRVDNLSHYHTTAYELVLVLNGNLKILVRDIPVLLPTESLLLIPANIPHAVMGGKGPIQHYILHLSKHSQLGWLIKTLLNL